jgi:hypothetical protein
MMNQPKQTTPITSRILARTAATAAAAGLAVLATLAGGAVAAADDYGPDTCLMGYVWREATPTDHVCVSPQTRQQARDDNSHADQRRAGGGAYGPDTCVQGYVWREATPGDHVCVTPQTRQQAKDDNSQADQRRDTVSVRLGTWTPNTVSCHDGVCTQTSDNAPRIAIAGDHFNHDTDVTITVAHNDGVRIATYTAHTDHNGTFSRDLNVLAGCPGAANAYIQAFDTASGRHSQRLEFGFGCATF